MLRELCSFPSAFQLEDILQQREMLAEIFKAMQVRLAYLHGSLLDGRGRDADFAVLFDNYSFTQSQDLYEGLCRILKADNIDLLPLNRASFELKKRVALSGLVIYETCPAAVSDFLEDMLTQLEDHRLFVTLAQAELEKRIKGGISMASRKLDAERVTSYLSRLDDVVARLMDLKSSFTSFEDFTAQVDRRELSVHYLRIALESVLDVCRHFLAVKGTDLDQVDTTNLIELAGKNGLLPPDFARRIRGMAGMRNAIVHLYWNLDYAAIYEAVSRLSDFDDFARYVLQFLQRQNRKLS
ncbi:DUF86 domain-containing protein [Dehalococcoidia bacterium]|nr:DUF86 domain-containing protein [Dehalococcoidia bacterium]